MITNLLIALGLVLLAALRSSAGDYTVCNVVFAVLAAVAAGVTVHRRVV